MEDRHTFSDPRPVPGLELPTWEVDVFREGVNEPVLTLLVDESTLPPRMRKKKLVWKLPSTIEEIPNFGFDEKKRLLDLFRKEKKNRRSNAAKKTKQTVETKPCVRNGDATLDEMPVSNQVDVSAERSILLPSDSDPENSSSGPIAIDSTPPPPPPPPGFNTTSQDANAAANRQPLVETKRHVPLHTDTVPGHSDLETATSDTNVPPGLGITSLSLEQSIAPPAFFVVPPLSTAVDLAKIVVDIYYPCITHGHSDELARHYAPNAMKSLSVGGAHAVCSTREQFPLQLQSLQHSQFRVKGVVAQEGFGDSVVLLITGSVENAVTQMVLPFCHTMILIRMAEGYQIHNDAMALLTE